MRRAIALAALLCAAATPPAQQVPDRGFDPAIGRSRYATGQEPAVCVFSAETLPSSPARTGSGWA